jgi:hypothetical protein
MKRHPALPPTLPPVLPPILPWTRPTLLLATALVLATALGGCATAVPTIPPAVRCDVPANLTQACDAPGLLEPGVLYRDLIRQSMADKQALLQCGSRQQALAAAVEICRRAVDQHNTELQAIDARLKAAR